MLRATIEFLRRRGIYVYRRGMPWGADLFRDLSLLGGVPDSATVFDVGANEGQTLERIKTSLPNGRVHCFEPATHPFRILVEKSRAYSDVVCHQLALSSAAGRAQLREGDVSVMNQIQPCEADLDVGTVAMSTVDSFATEQGIDRVHLLKIDTEGHDLEVLKGADTMLREHRVDYILTEVGFGDADWFVGDIEMREFMRKFGYRLLCVYDQSPTDYGHGWPHVGLYFANLLFVRRNHPPK